MTLNRMYHWVPRTISGDSQMSGLSCKATISETDDGKQQVGRERGEKLRHRLHDRVRCGPQSDIDADRRPDHAGERDQHDHAQHGDEAEPSRRGRALRCGKRDAGECQYTRPQRRYSHNPSTQAYQTCIGDARRRCSRRRRRPASAGCQSVGPAHQRRRTARRARRSISSGATWSRPRIRRLRLASVPARCGNGRPRRPAAGTAAGRRSG